MTTVSASAAKQSPSGCAASAGDIAPRLLRAYRDTIYQANGTDIRIGRRSSNLPLERLGARTAVLLTAWNPWSRRMPVGWNHRMQRALLLRLRRFRLVGAQGSLGCWHEAMFLVAGDPRPLVRLAATFRQRAVVVLRRGDKARVQLLG